MKGEVVVVLHGLARTARSVAPLERTIAAAGFRTWSATYPSRKLSIAELAAHLATRIREEAPAERYSAVTHSLGGIVVRYLHDALPWHRVVMLAPPNRGSRLALAFREQPLFRFIFGRAGHELADPSEWPGPPSPFAVIAGTRSGSVSNPISWITKSVRFFPPEDPSDGTVSVEETKHPAMADFATVDATHTLIMNHPEAQALTLRFLERGRF